MAALFRVALARSIAPAVARAAIPARCMATGTVKWFDTKKGFGFITPDEVGQPDVFAHQSSVQSGGGFRMLVEAEKVKYDVQPTDRGVHAVNITNLDGTPIVRDPTARSFEPRSNSRDGGDRDRGDRDRGDRDRSERPRRARKPRDGDGESQ